MVSCKRIVYNLISIAFAFALFVACAEDEAKKHTDRGSVFMTSGIEAFVKGDTETAIGHLERALYYNLTNEKVKSALAECYVQQGYAYYTNGEYAHAYHAYRLAEKHRGGDTNISAMAATAFFTLEENAGAGTTIIREEMPPFISNMHESAARPKEKPLPEAKAIPPKRGTREALVRAYRANGVKRYIKRNYDRAIDQCLLVLTYAPRDKKAKEILFRSYVERAYTYVKKGYYEAALADYAEALRLRPRSKVVKELRQTTQRILRMFTEKE